MYKDEWELFPDTAKLSVELSIDKNPRIPEDYKVFFSQHDNEKQYLQQQFIMHHKKRKKRKDIYISCACAVQ